jgi:Holliday junction resolvase
LNGWPDLCAVKDGTTIYIEVKRPGGRTSKIQDYRIKQLREAGVKVYVTDSLDVFEEMFKD